MEVEPLQGHRWQLYTAAALLALWTAFLLWMALTA